MLHIYIHIYTCTIDTQYMKPQQMGLISRLREELPVRHSNENEQFDDDDHDQQQPVFNAPAGVTRAQLGHTIPTIASTQHTPILTTQFHTPVYIYIYPVWDEIFKVLDFFAIGAR